MLMPDITWFADRYGFYMRNQTSTPKTSMATYSMLRSALTCNWSFNFQKFCSEATSRKSCHNVTEKRTAMSQDLTY